MFILRKINSSDIQMNITLGEQYSYITKIDNNKEFARTYEALMDKSSTDDDGTIYAFVISEGGKDIIPLYNTQHNYIMTDSGKTFAHLKSN